MEVPTTKQIRAWSKVEFAELGYEEPGGEAEDPLDIIVERAVEYVVDVTGRDPFIDIPEALKQTAREAVQRRTEQLAFQEQEDHVETAADELIQSMSAGSYSETKRGAGDLSITKTKLVNPWPLLHDLLWRLMTEEKREWWEEQITGIHKPAMSTTEVDWHAGDVLENYFRDEFYPYGG